MKRIVLLSLLFLVAGCSTASENRKNYPSTWWKPVDKETAKSWEILPQEAGPGEVILSKRNELGVFSNFGATPFVLDGEKYASVEGLWQMMKYPENSEDERAIYPGLEWVFSRDQVKKMISFEAKRAGKKADKNMKKMGIHWISYKGKKFEYKGSGQKKHYDIIFRAIKAKIEQNPEVKKLLLKTKGLKLLPDHHQKPNAPPSYHYHKMLMKIRDNLASKNM